MTIADVSRFTEASHGGIYPYMNVRRLALVLCATTSFTECVLRAETIVISPRYINVGVGQTAQYQVTGVASPIWAVSNAVGGNATYGTISATGLYTAPAVIPANSPLVEVMDAARKVLAAVYVNVAPAGPPITAISPNPIPAGNFTITVTGAGFKSGAIVSLNGTANLPTTFVSATTLKASGWQGAGSASFYVMNPGSLWGHGFAIQFVQGGPPPPQSISPASMSLNFGATQQFTSANASSWSATSGTVSATGFYTAPASQPPVNPVKVTATGPGGTATALVTVLNPNPQVIVPAAVTLNLGATQQFTSIGATAWTAVSGSITATGLYTGPASVPAGGTDTVTVTGPNGKATAAITLIPPVPTISAVGANGQLPLGAFAVTITGTGFTNVSIARLGTTALNTTAFTASTLSVSGFSATSGTVNLTVSNGAATSPPFPVQVGIPNAQVSAAAARRFLEQAAFGPTPTDAAHVQAVGFQAWLNEQFAMAPVSNYNANAASSQGGLNETFLTNAVMNSDQLRQRVAFALSQVFVTSINTLIWNQAVIPYQQMLMADSFGNYRQLLGDVTLSPAMGQYLNMANNAKANAAAGSVANENYAREILQLFSIGTTLLNPDGSIQLDANNLPAAAYTQSTITEFARAFTGWTYAPPAGSPVNWNVYPTQNGPMVVYAPMHDNGAKTLLNGYVSPAGVSAQQDLTNALDNIFGHANVGPFIGRQLIQHLVKSNPGPAYVSRVAAAFDDNGNGVRGDMKAVITAILLDPEARANDNGGSDQPTDGHLQEPALFIAGIVRAFGGQMTPQNYFSWDLYNLGQVLYDAPSVFNYYSPNYRIPGTTLKGGEFQIGTPDRAVYRANIVAGLFGGWNNPIATYGPGTTVDLTPFVALAAQPATLVAALDLTLTHGAMPAAMKQALINAVTAEQGGNVARVQTGVYLILTSSYYSVWH
ncbi:MAG: DUF1800 family protein [Terriglobia bacterium]